jgi:hypothetical protein
LPPNLPAWWGWAVWLLRADANHQETQKRLFRIALRRNLDTMTDLYQVHGWSLRERAMVTMSEDLLRDRDRVTPAGVVDTKTASDAEVELWGHESAPVKQEKPERELAEATL